ncbi:MAG: MFS transporter [Desulfamplus sp.]|nr:MFS transporter [Desulfamplus sp.]
MLYNLLFELYIFIFFEHSIDFQKNILIFSTLKGNHKGLPLQCSCQFNYLENYIKNITLNYSLIFTTNIEVANPYKNRYKHPMELKLNKNKKSNYISRISGLVIIPSLHKKIFITLFFTIFATVTGVGIVVPLLPVYAKNMGAAGIYVGMVFGSFSFSRTLLLPYFGKLSDQKGRKPFIVAGLAGYTVISFAFLMTNNVSSLIVIRALQGIASAMVMPVVQAYVGEITPEGMEGYAMSLFNLSMFTSLSIGPVMGGAINDFWSLDAAFICMGLLSLAGLALSMIYLPSINHEYIKHKNTPSIPWSIFIKDMELMGFFICRFAYTGCIGIIWCFMPIFAQSRLPAISGLATGILVTLGVFVSGLLQLPMGYLADRVNRRVMVVVGGVICAFSMFMMFESTSYLQLVCSISVFGLGGGICMPPLMALTLIKGNEKCAMASVMAIITVAHSLGMMAGSMGAGFAMDYFSLDVIFPCGTALMFIGVILFAGLTTNRE